MGQKKQQWIKLYRSIKDSAVWSDPLRLKAWIDILITANYKDNEWFQNGQPIKVKRGQFVTSIRKLSTDWKCSRDTVRRILKQFEELHMIRHEIRPGKYTLITVIKYEVFQDSKEVVSATDEDTEQDTDKYTDKATDKDTDTTQLRIVKNIEKEKKDKEPPPPEPPDVGPDGFGEIPEGWTEQDEEEFKMMYEDNDWKTRKKWAEYWKE